MSDTKLQPGDEVQSVHTPHHTFVCVVAEPDRDGYTVWRNETRGGTYFLWKNASLR